MRRKKPDAIGLEPEEWVNDAGYRYRARRAFDAAQAQIHAERRALELVRAGERLATPEERAAVSPRFPRSPRPPYAPPERGHQGAAAAVVVITTALALTTFMAVLVYLGVNLS